MLNEEWMMRRRLWTAGILYSQLLGEVLFIGAGGSYRRFPFYRHPPRDLRIRTAAVQSLRRKSFAFRAVVV